MSTKHFRKRVMIARHDMPTTAPAHYRVSSQLRVHLWLEDIRALGACR